MENRSGNKVTVVQPIFRSASTFFGLLFVLMVIFNLVLIINRNFRQYFFSLMEPKGTLSVEVEGGGIQPKVYFDLQYMGTIDSSPLVKNDVVEGKYVLKVEEPSYMPYYQEIDISGGQTVKVYVGSKKTDKQSRGIEELHLVLTPIKK
ncbi:MAG: PEGA domain-containing protein [bacterium]